MPDTQLDEESLSHMHDVQGWRHRLEASSLAPSSTSMAIAVAKQTFQQKAALIAELAAVMSAIAFFMPAMSDAEKSVSLL